MELEDGGKRRQDGETSKEGLKESDRAESDRKTRGNAVSIMMLSRDLETWEGGEK
jgi:hypothetical protein